ncbi:N-(5'-phosphoribosyl)anthranilate isomerase [Rhodobacteraceae bacterium CCMM004]|nr:N-(5'-phosphoribosyl)anthranilate isomerase [Rhodobacteraceae bacterium CCMM004]
MVGGMLQTRAIPPPAQADRWIAGIFSARAAQTGGVVRRSIAWVEREVGTERLMAEVRARGFHMVQVGGQYVIICNPGGLRVIC